MQGWEVRETGRRECFSQWIASRLANISRCHASVFRNSWRSFSNGLSTVWHVDNDGICWKLPGSAKMHTQLSMV